MLLLDGVVVQEPAGDVLLALPVTDVDRIELLKNSGAAMYGVRGANGVIAIYTKRFRPSQLKKDKGMTPLRLIGYPSVQREFYVPRYEAEPTEQSVASTRPDRRDVLYWKPIIQTDDQGHTQLLFPLSDVVKTVRVTVQGITSEGRPVVGVGLMNVQ